MSIPVFAMVDTCCDPTDIDYVIPQMTTLQNLSLPSSTFVCAAIAEGTGERKLEKEKEAQKAEAAAPRQKGGGKPRIKKAVRAAVDAEEEVVADVVAATEAAAEKNEASAE